jgi:hypothetical protein
MDQPKTHKLKTESIQGVLCKCNKCNITQRCTFRTDFYTLSFIEYKDGELQPLYCEACMWSEHTKYEKNLNRS